MRGDLMLELQLLRKLCEQCGQLWMYPGTGSPAIVVDASTDPEKAASLWERSDNQPDRWRWFYERMYDDYD